MGKNKLLFTCSKCESEYSKWSGRCPSCMEWNTISETISRKGTKAKFKTESYPLSKINLDKVSRIQTSLREFNLVCGGGIVPGSIILVGGEPGIGKSTLALQIAGCINSLYISGEESPSQLRQRADRIGIDPSVVNVSTNTVVEEIVSLIESDKKIKCLIVDSIQTIYSLEVPGIRGSVNQIRESVSKIADIVKSINMPVILIGHITKDGSIAGPKLLEHIVDTVLYFEGDFSNDFRILRSFKNRYGSVNEMGLFRMSAKGLIEVTDKNKIFLNPFGSKSPGNAVSAAVEGSRTILFEVQSLVSFTSFSNPRRMADGFDLNRLILLIAVLEKHAGLKLNSYDVFINVSGGFRINETASDLAVAMAIASSLKEKPIPEGTGFLGEISLSGDIRPVSQCSRRINEFNHSGYDRVLMSEGDMKNAGKGFGGKIIGIKKISESLESIFV